MTIDTAWGAAISDCQLPIVRRVLLAACHILVHIALAYYMPEGLLHGAASIDQYMLTSTRPHAMDPPTSVQKSSLCLCYHAIQSDKKDSAVPRAHFM